MAINSILLPTDYNFASPQVIIDIYSATSDNLILLGSSTGVISASTSKSIRDRDGGKFQIQLAPGGPNGVNDPTTWVQTIVPFSLAVISMKRGQSKAVVMVGLITAVKEVQSWNNKMVTRLTQIEGLDFFLYFRQFCFYVLKFLGILDSIPELFGPAGTAVNPNVTAGYIGDQNPSQAAIYWYQNVMMGTIAGDTLPPPSGPKPGVLSNTYVNYRSVKQKIRQFFGTWFENYDDGGGGVFSNPIIIPISINFLMAEGDFMSKFTEIMPWPFYEFFTITAPIQIQGITLYPNLTNAAQTIQSSDSGIPPAQSCVIGRVNPLPWVAQDSSNNKVWYNQRFENLLTYDFTSSSFINSEIEYNLDDVRNFYVVSPMSPLNQNGTNPSSIQGAIQQMGFMYDFTSVTRYGFRPEVDSVMWWADGFGNLPGMTRGLTSSELPSPDQFARAISRVASYYEPTPYMLNSTIEIPLWPEVLPGNVFRYRPYKSDVIYLCYIESVEHIFEFGGNSKTKLVLTRGLLETDYTNTKLMIALHTGNIDRIDGVLTPTTNNQGLTYATLGQVNFGSGMFATWSSSGVPTTSGTTL